MEIATIMDVESIQELDELWKASDLAPHAYKREAIDGACAIYCW
jgi:hypothetical protein